MSEKASSAVRIAIIIVASFILRAFVMWIYSMFTMTISLLVLLSIFIGMFAGGIILKTIYGYKNDVVETS